MRDYFRSLLLLVVGCLVGVFCCNFTFFEFEKQISFVDLSSLLVTSIIGLYIATKIQDSQSIQKTEKEIFISELKEILLKISFIKACYDANQFPFSDTVKFFKDINTDVHLINDLTDTSKKCRNVEFKNMFSYLQSMRNTITMISPHNGVINLSNDDLIIVDSMLSNLKKEAYSLILEINKA
jgi:hypothetical protein